jgi:hypothetical protein
MKILGFELFGSGAKTPVSEARPLKAYSSSEMDVVEMQFPRLGLESLFSYVYYSDTYRAITDALVRELFRNGADFTPKFTAKCTNNLCQAEFDYEVENCPECNSPTREPDHQQQWIFKEFVSEANANGQPLEAVMKSIEIDLDAVDNGYLLVLKAYTFGAQGEIIGADVKELLRGDPRVMRKIIDRKGRPGYDWDSGKRIHVCPMHRNKAQEGPRCSDCQLKLYPAYFVAFSEIPTYYLAGEVCHRTKYSQTIYYGFPPILTLLPKIQILLAQDKYMRAYYYGKKSPKGILAWMTGSVESAEKKWSEFVDRAIEEPNNVFPLFINPGQANTNGDVVKFIDLMRTPQEMQYIDVRQELITKIGAFHGVMPIFQADLSQSAGLNSEGLQVTVTTRAVETGQSVHNSFFAFLGYQLGLVDWEYKLNPPEEKDEMAELQREAQKIANAQGMKNLGFEVSLDDSGEFKFTEKPEGMQNLPFGQIPEFGAGSTDEASGTPDKGRLDGEPFDEGRMMKTAAEKKNSQDQYEEAIKSAISRFTRGNAKELITAISRSLVMKFDAITDKYFTRIYKEKLIELENRLGIDLGFTKDDRDTLMALKSQRVLSRAYQDLAQNVEKMVNEATSKSESKEQLASYIDEIKTSTSSNAELIARTETAKIQSAANLTNFRKAFPKGFMVRHAGPTDERTTKTCRRIMERTRKGVTEAEYYDTLKEESAKDFPTWTVDREAPVAHIQCRHRPEVLV